MGNELKRKHRYKRLRGEPCGRNMVDVNSKLSDIQFSPNAFRYQSVRLDTRGALHPVIDVVVAHDHTIQMRVALRRLQSVEIPKYN